MNKSFPHSKNARSRIIGIFIALFLFIGTTLSFALFDEIGRVFEGADAVKDMAEGFSGVSVEQELDIGGSLALEIAARNGGILKDAEITKRVATIGKALSLYCKRPELKFTFGVLDNPDVNAISAPGGYVFVTKGLVDACKDDQQLAGVLAHEIVHITQRHALKRISGSKGTKGVLKALSASGQNFSGFDDLISKGINEFVEKGLPPGDEFDADKGGTTLAYDAGFQPQGLRDYLKKLSDKDHQKTFCTHPKTKERVKRLDRYLEESGILD